MEVISFAGSGNKQTGRSKKSDTSASTDSTISTSAILSIVQKLKTERIRSSTKRNYYSVWKTFNQFFIRLDNKLDTWEERLTLFIGYLIEERKFKSQSVRSYVSAIRGVLQEDGVTLNEDKFLLSALTSACKLKNDRVTTRLPLRKAMLCSVVNKTAEYFMQELNQPYLAHLYCALFSTA